MTGIVGDSGRALLRIRLKNSTLNDETELDAWVDTGFTGDLVVPQKQAQMLGLPLGVAVSAGLADGSKVTLETYMCLVEWFGVWKKIEVIATNQGEFPLLGVGLLLEREININYRAKTLWVVQSA